MRRTWGVLVALGMVLAACGSDSASSDSVVDTDPTATASPPSPSTEVATSVVATEPDSTDPPPSEPASTDPETTDPETTAAPPTTIASAGWVESDFVPGAALQGYSGNWAGDGGPSPAAPADGDTPADGYYVASVIEPWDPSNPDELSVRIERLELCTDLPDGCDNMDDPTEMNLDPAWQLDLDVPLDATTDVIVAGFACWGTGDERTREQKQATGVELADLFTAYTADYDVAIRPDLAGGPGDYELAQQVAASPTGGFVGEATLCPDDADVGGAGPLRYVHDDAPVLLLQTVTDWDGGPLDATDLVRLNGVQYTDGVPTYYFYAGFYS